MAKSDKEIILELTIRKDNLEKGIVKLENTIKKAKAANEDYSMSLKKVELSEIKLATTTAKLERHQKSLGKEVEKTTKTMKQAKSATGATTSAAMELGRVVSDAPYGIRGMANNISQFASQMVYAAKATDATTGKLVGMKNAFKGLGKAMMGTTGVLFLIQGVIALLDHLYGGMKKTEEGTESLTATLETQIDVLDGYRIALDESNLSLEQRSGIVKAAGVSDKEFLKILKQTTGSLDDKVRALRLHIKAKEDELKIKQKVAKFDEANAIIKEAEITDVEVLEEKLRKLNIMYEASLKSTKESATFSILRYGREIDDIEKVLGALRDRLSLEEEINDLIVDEEPVVRGSVEWLKKRISETSKHRDSVSTVKSEWEAASIAVDGYKKKLEAITGKNKELKPRDKATGIDINWDLAPTTTEQEAKREKQMKEILKTFKDSTELKLKKDPLTIVPELDVKLPDSFYENLAKDKVDKLKEFTLTSQLEDFEEYADLVKQSVSAVSSFISGEYERELAIEQNKTNALNEELNNRLINENLSKDQRKKIQDQIANNDEKLRKKQDAINRKKFNAEKAANIAMTLMNTATAAVGVMKDAKGGFFARLSQALPTIAFGLAQVATIARTKYQTAAPSTPSRTTGGGSGTGDGAGDRSFNFNLVGASQQNQLLNAIQSKFETPLKAFVVSKDITTQQELDVNIKGTATL